MPCGEECGEEVSPVVFARCMFCGHDLRIVKQPDNLMLYEGVTLIDEESGELVGYACETCVEDQADEDRARRRG